MAYVARIRERPAVRRISEAEAGLAAEHEAAASG